MAKFVAKIVLCALFNPFLLLGQNLIVNGSIESWEGCPNRILPNQNVLRGLDKILLPNMGTTDWISDCNSHLPYNFVGKQLPHHGHSYVGIIAANKFLIFSEYIQFEFRDELLVDRNYFLGFNISLSEGSQKALTKFTAGMNRFPLNDVGKRYLKCEREFDFYGEFKDTANWTFVTTIFQAEGWERTLILGKFNRSKKNVTNVEIDRTTKVPFYNSYDTSDQPYYFIDNAYLIEIPFDYEHTREEQMAISDIITISNTPPLNIGFQIAQLELLNTSVSREQLSDSLHLLIEYLKFNPFTTINISFPLSTNRHWTNRSIELLEKAIYDWFEFEGISYNRVWLNFEVMSKDASHPWIVVSFKDILFDGKT